MRLAVVLNLAGHCLLQHLPSLVPTLSVALSSSAPQQLPLVCLRLAGWRLVPVVVRGAAGA